MLNKSRPLCPICGRLGSEGGREIGGGSERSFPLRDKAVWDKGKNCERCGFGPSSGVEVFVPGRQDGYRQ